MKVIEARNAHMAIPMAARLLAECGIRRESRNGPVLMSPEPVTTVFTHPQERVVFWEQRDANPFFHLYEALWMLAGRNDITGPARYAKNMLSYSDDGKTQHAAYGYRWRREFAHTSPTLSSRDRREPIDQLELIGERLRRNPDDRRCVLQMWDTALDLDVNGKDVPCNTTATFQVNHEGKLDLVVFNRSNDIVWGTYGANAVHFSFLLEYMALRIGVPMGTYTQVSVNWHAYENTYHLISGLGGEGYPADVNRRHPYLNYHAIPMWHGQPDHIDQLDQRIEELLLAADTGFHLPVERKWNDDEPFFSMAHTMLQAHQCYRTLKGAARYSAALAVLAGADSKADWIQAGRQWLERRYLRYSELQTTPR